MVTSDGYGSWKILWQKVEGQYLAHMALSIFITLGKEETIIQISNYQSLIQQSDERILQYELQFLSPFSTPMGHT
jgi:hypothetical protein